MYLGTERFFNAECYILWELVEICLEPFIPSSTLIPNHEGSPAVNGITGGFCVRVKSMRRTVALFVSNPPSKHRAFCIALDSITMYPEQHVSATRGETRE